MDRAGEQYISDTYAPTIQRGPQKTDTGTGQREWWNVIR
ncbi:hypothetical protein PABG_11439 [Paracoccidioides brasiliensis Pb03]|nr:hypothetical protein PABG_11439 [Paracoccidioides brasiliensis Pb03]